MVFTGPVVRMCTVLRVGVQSQAMWMAPGPGGRQLNSLTHPVMMNLHTLLFGRFLRSDENSSVPWPSGGFELMPGGLRVCWPAFAVSLPPVRPS